MRTTNPQDEFAAQVCLLIANTFGSEPNASRVYTGQEVADILAAVAGRQVSRTETRTNTDD